MSNKLRLDRKQLAALFQNNHQAIVAFEKVLGDTGQVLPTTIEEAAAQATQALAMAGQALSMMQEFLSVFEAIETAPEASFPAFPDDTAPTVQVGSLASQSADNVRIEGGTVDNTPIGSAGASSGAFTSISASAEITSSVADGTAPFIVESTTPVDNLHVARATLADEASKLAAPTTLPAAATDLPTVITLANALRTAAIAKGL